MVKYLVATGQRPSPKDLLVLSDHALEDWVNEEAVRYLQEQKAARQSQQPLKGA